MAYEFNMFEGCEGLFICMASWANSITEGMFWSVILIVMGIILFMATFKFGTARAFGYSSISMSFIALLLIQAALIPGWFLSLILVVGGIGVVSMIMNAR